MKKRRLGAWCCWALGRVNLFVASWFMIHDSWHDCKISFAVLIASTYWSFGAATAKYVLTCTLHAACHMSNAYSSHIFCPGRPLLTSCSTVRSGMATTSWSLDWWGVKAWRTDTTSSMQLRSNLSENKWVSINSILFCCSVQSVVHMWFAALYMSPSHAPCEVS